MDWKDQGPQTEYNGRRCKATIEVTFYLKGEADEDQLTEWLEYEIGGGSITTANPLVSGAAEADFGDVFIDRLRIEDVWSYTDWGAVDEEGSRRGRTRFELTPPEKADV